MNRTINDMKESGLPEAERAMDLTAEKVFDDLAWLAAQICEAPIAVVSVSSKGGQRVKSKVGLTACEAEHEFRICEELLSDRRMEVVGDALQDKRLARDPLVIGGPKLRFFAGLPLITLDGVPVGTLSVMDKVPRKLSTEQVYALEVLARQLVHQLEWRKQASV